MHIPVVNTTESHYSKESKTHCASNRTRRVHRKHKCHKNYDLSDNNLQCGQTLSSDEKEHLRNIVLDYKTKTNKTEISKPCKVSIQHKTILKDDKPISLSMRRIPYYIGDKVKEKVNDLIENNFAEYSDSPYNAPLVPLVKKNGDIKLYFDYRELNEKTIPNKNLFLDLMKYLKS